MDKCGSKDIVGSKSNKCVCGYVASKLEGYMALVDFVVSRSYAILVVISMRAKEIYYWYLGGMFTLIIKQFDVIL